MADAGVEGPVTKPLVEPTVRVVVKRAPLVFGHGHKGRGTVSLVEQSPLSVMGDPQVARGRHFAKRYFLRVEGFRVKPTVGHAADDPLYLYVLRESLAATQVSHEWSLVDGALVNASLRVRALHDTTDSELVLFDQVVMCASRWPLSYLVAVRVPHCASMWVANVALAFHFLILCVSRFSRCCGAFVAPAYIPTRPIFVVPARVWGQG
jgi:hypothetical protein